MFNLFFIVPTFNDFDAVTGHRAIAHPYSFLTEGGAIAMARLLDDDDQAYTVVVPAGASPFDQKAQVRRFAREPLDADLPF